MSSLKRTLQLRADVPGDLSRAADLLRSGRLVAFPTETVYGLGANALDASAVAKIFIAKQRPSWDPLIVHISNAFMLGQVADLSGPVLEKYQRLAGAFWPGPLTLLLPRAGTIADAVTAGRPRVGTRMPAHPVALALIEEAGIPVAAPSANRFGHISPTTPAHVLDDLDGRIDAVLDGGASSIGVESTVLDVCEDPMLLYRPGAISLEQIIVVAGPTEIFHTSSSAGTRSPQSLPSPGLNLRHYAPIAKLLLVEDRTELLAASYELAPSGRVGVMLPDGWDPGPASLIFPWGSWNAPQILARRLFSGLRELDSQAAATILCPLPQQADGLPAALRDRLLKAARRL